MNTTDPPFERTTCACAKCVRCCKDQPGPLIPGDFERIAAHVAEKQKMSLEIAFQWLKKHLWASPGALVKDIRTGKMHRVGTITPRRVKTPQGRRCTFLDEHDRCTIHGVAPFGCAFFDTHMPNAVAHTRGVWAVKRQLDDDYQRLRDELPYAESYKPSGY